MPTGSSQAARPIAQFWLLGALLILIFLTGGSQRADAQSLQILRPIAIFIAAMGLFLLKREHCQGRKSIFYLLLAVMALTIAHLIPLPPEVWHALPGRGIIREIDALAGLRDQWRPLSMVPIGTWNALYSLSVPFAVLVLTVQLGPTDQIRLLLLLIALIVLSGAVGLLQAIGMTVFTKEQADIAGLFANRNHQGVALALLFPMLAAAATWGEAVLPKRVALMSAGALALIAVPLIIITGSRAGLIALIIAIVLIPLIGFRLRAATRTRRSRWLAYAQYGFAIAVLGVLVWMTVIASRETALIRFEQTDELRLPVWASIIDALPTYMPWGSGIGSYADVYQILEPDSLLRPTFSNHAHNEWLEIALTAGWPGVALIIWAIALFIYAAFWALRAPRLEGVLSRLGLSILLVLAFASTVDYPVRTPIMASVFTIAAVWASSFKGFGKDNGRN